MTTNTITKTDAARQAAFVINRTVYQPSKQRLISRFAENVRAELKRQHMTQLELAQKSGVLQGNLSWYVLGKREPKLTTAYLIAKALDVSLDSLLN